MLRRKLYAIFAKAVVSPDKLMPLLPAHLQYLIDLVKLFASGPLTDVGAGPLSGGGLTFLRAASAAEAREIAEAEPRMVFALSRSRSGPYWKVHSTYVSTYPISPSRCCSAIFRVTNEDSDAIAHAQRPTIFSPYLRLVYHWV